MRKLDCPAIASVLTAEGMEATVAQRQAEKAVILVQGSLILAQGLNDVQIFKRVIGDLAKELLLNLDFGASEL